MSKAIANTLQNETGLSPKQIDYLIKGYAGAVGEFFWRIPDVIKNIKDTPTDFADYPVIKSFITDSAYSSGSMDKFYNYGKELSTRKKGYAITGEYKGMGHLPPELQIKLFNEGLEPARKEYNRIAKMFTDARKKINAIGISNEYTPTEKKKEIRKINKQMNDLAKDFNDRYEELKRSSSIK